MKSADWRNGPAGVGHKNDVRMKRMNRRNRLYSGGFDDSIHYIAHTPFVSMKPLTARNWGLGRGLPGREKRHSNFVFECERDHGE